MEDTINTKMAVDKIKRRNNTIVQSRGFDKHGNKGRETQH